MTTFGITVAGTAQDRWVAVPVSSKRTKLTVRGTMGGTVITVPYAPQTGSRQGLAGVWTRQTRPGRSDASVWTSQPTPVLALDLTFMHTDFRQDVEVVLKQMRELVGSEEAVLLSGCSPSWAGPWAITDATEDVQDLTPQNKLAKVVLHTTFTATDKSNLDGTGPITGGVKFSKVSTARTYIVKRGDTLPKIAARVLGDSSLYGIIAAINNLRTTKLHVGQKLKLPDMGKKR